MQVDACAGGLEWRHALRQQPADGPRQHVAGPGGGERGIAWPVEPQRAVGRCDERTRALEDDDMPPGAGAFARRR